jgi:LacI family transcriptional regulator
MSVLKKPSLKDIAQETQLSITTVSRVINGKAKQYRIGKKSQKLVLDAAKKLNYNANYAAANLRSGKSSTIALLVPSLSNPFFASMASEINQDLHEEGFITILSESSENLDIEKDLLNNLLKRNIEGLIIVPCGDQYEHILKLKKQGLPIVCIDRYFEDLDLPYVSTDNYDGAYKATKYLIDNGHSRIFAIQGISQSVPNQQRAKGFKDAMRDTGIKNINISGNDFSVQNGYLETKLILQSKERPTAIFTFSNTIAMGCLKALREEELNIPEDISLITFDDHPYLDYLATPLSCVVQPESDIAKLATRFLFSMLNNNGIEPQQVLLKPEIKIRNSVRRVQA